MRGMAIEISRSMNSHMRSPRSVTLAPIALPSRSLKPAIDFLARVTTGFWPVIVARSRTAPSSREAWAVAAPTPMLSTTLESRGTCMTLPMPSSCWSWPRSVSSYRAFSRGTTRSRVAVSVT